MASTQSMLPHHRLAVITVAVLALLRWSDIVAATVDAHTTLEGTNGRYCFEFFAKAYRSTPFSRNW